VLAAQARAKVAEIEVDEVKIEPLSVKDQFIKAVRACKNP
jgi:hypothetical protein